MTDSKITDELLREMLAGLEGVTPGPWEVVGSSITDWGREWEASMSMEFVPNGHEDGINSRSDEDAAHIARCDPDTMRSILTELIASRQPQPVNEPAEWQVEAACAEYKELLGREISLQAMARILRAARNAVKGSTHE